ncbi:MAG: 3-dehydroquinate synthase [Cytophagaceae bacterium]|nr:3-dehydroquinate synthase [Cytophagaceae bacterium]
MNVIQQVFGVPFAYRVFFTENLFDTGNPTVLTFLNSAGEPGFQKKILFLIDSGVADTHPYLFKAIPAYLAQLPDLTLVAEPMVLPGGEGVKNDPAYVEQVLDAVDTHGIDRHSFVVAIGGGAFLDMVGYASAIAHRGVKHIRIPTTVLAQNDSGVGVKNGVNYRGKKNFLGTFAPPVAVFNDAAFLPTLDDRDWRSGIAEALKVALIKDKSFFEWLETAAEALVQRDAAAMQRLIFRCAQLHMEHIASGDPFETGSARPLDFGHWAAHKLEYLTNFELRHGEAVAIGIALDTVYSHLAGLIGEEDVQRVLNVFQRVGFELYHPALAENDKRNLWNGLNEFREHLGGQLTITVLEALGKGLEVHEIDFDRVKASVDYLEQLYQPAE